MSIAAVAAFPTLSGFADAEDFLYEDDPHDNAIPDIQKITRANNVLPIWGNTHSMNLNSLVLENITSSAYTRNNLSEIKTYNQIVDEIYYNVGHLEPWERGTRKTTGQTGMCGGVRGVGAGGVVSSAYCLLYKLFTMRITRKLLVGMINREDSCYIRGLGFMFIRYTQPPADLWAWMEPYLDDEEEIDPKSGGGDRMTVGQMVKLMLTKLDWYGTLFPRIPVPIQKQIEDNFRGRMIQQRIEAAKKKEKEDAKKEAWDEKHMDERDHRDDRYRETSRSRDEDRSRREVDSKCDRGESRKIGKHHHDHSKHRHKDGAHCSKYYKWVDKQEGRRKGSKSRSRSPARRRRSRSNSRSNRRC